MAVGGMDGRVDVEFGKLRRIPQQDLLREEIGRDRAEIVPRLRRDRAEIGPRLGRDRVGLRRDRAEIGAEIDRSS